jgi:hypothetical protein
LEKKVPTQVPQINLIDQQSAMMRREPADGGDVDEDDAVEDEDASAPKE